MISYVGLPLIVTSGLSSSYSSTPVLPAVTYCVFCPAAEIAYSCFGVKRNSVTVLDPCARLLNVCVTFWTPLPSVRDQAIVLPSQTNAW